MLKKLAITAVAALTLSGTAALAAGGEGHVEDVAFSFEGPFGTYDQNQLQRGLQVYTEVCSACHGLRYVPLRTLGDEGGPHLPEDQVRAYAENFEVFDSEIDDYRSALPTDHYPTSGDPNAPDLSLMAKARAGFHGPYGLGLNQLFKGLGGAEYIYSILTGYTGKEVEQAGSVLYENRAFPGGRISMPPPLSEGLVEYEVHGGAEGEDEGHGGGYQPPEATVEQMAKDVSAFLMWTAEPKLVERKQAGFRNIIFLVVLTVLLYFTNKVLWAPIKRKDKAHAGE